MSLADKFYVEQAVEPTISERELVTRAKARDESAWATIYDRHYEALYRYAYARLRSREDAEDLAAQVFLEALRGIDRFEYRGVPLLAWLYRIAANLTKQKLKRRVREPLSMESQHVFDQAQVGSSAPFDLFEILDLVGRLTEDQREVIILRFVVALQIKEVAHVLGKSQTAIVSLQSRALASLRRFMSDQPRELSRERSAA